MITISDFVYLCIILSVILISVVSITLGDSSRAGENLNFGATLVSIVLAVIAIVMTIVDSAGQKHSIADLKETTQSLNKSSEEIRGLIANTTHNLEDVNNLREQFIQNMQEINVWKDNLSDTINSFVAMNSSVDVQEVKEKLNDINLKIRKPFDYDQTFRVLIDVSEEYKPNVLFDQIKDEIYENFNGITLRSLGERVNIGNKKEESIREVIIVLQSNIIKIDKSFVGILFKKFSCDGKLYKVLSIS